MHYYYPYYKKTQINPIVVGKNPTTPQLSSQQVWLGDTAKSGFWCAKSKSFALPLPSSNDLGGAGRGLLPSPPCHSTPASALLGGEGAFVADFLVCWFMKRKLMKTEDVDP